MPFTIWLTMLVASLVEGRATMTAMLERMEEGLLVHPDIGIP